MAEKYGVATPLPRSKYLTNGQKLLNQALGKGADFGRPQNNSFAGKSFNEESLFGKPKVRKNIPPLLPQSTKHGLSLANNRSTNISRDLHANSRANHSFVHESNVSHSLGRKPMNHPLSALLGPLTSIKRSPGKQRDADLDKHDKSDTQTSPPKTRLVSIDKPKSPFVVQSKPGSPQEVIDIDKNPEHLPGRYGYLVRSKNMPLAKVTSYLIIVVKGLHYSLKCLKPPSLKFIQSKKIRLKDTPISAGKEKTLFLDLDETIVYQCKDDEIADFEIPLEDNQKLRFSARPHWQKFLKEASKMFEIVIYTASTQTYASIIVKTLDPNSQYITQILSRGSCLMTKNGFFIKDLRLIENRKLKNVVLLDNYVHSFAFNLENGVPILEWRNDREDDELIHMLGYLQELSDAPDIRTFNRERLNLASIPAQTSFK